MGILENAPGFYPQIPCSNADTKIKPPFLPGILPGRHVNASKEDPCRYIAGNFRPSKRALSVRDCPCSAPVLDFLRPLYLDLGLVTSRA
ncbi:hypothetical protein TNCT_432721 [Trichonephila clavata]|uniref:Uncharacterized protein n=1 Tax=Trichonephila clavata TaxID=2740835 RepID=A0A8X6JHH5_TRICU|nr:hypothetical protein TNCT_432721 [Trichonephila clavata]